MKTTLGVLGVVAIMVLAISAAIMAAAPYLAIAIVGAGIWAYCTSDSDDNTPPQQ